MPNFPLELITPEARVMAENVRSVRAPGIEGSLGVLANHAPLMTALTVGVLKIEHDNGDMEYISISGGFMQVTPDKVIILADTAERAADIDVARAEADISRARERLNSGEAIDYDRARKALERATNRLKVKQLKEETEA